MFPASSENLKNRSRKPRLVDGVYGIATIVGYLKLNLV